MVISFAVADALASSLTACGYGDIRAEDVLSELSLVPHRRSEIGIEAARLLTNSGLVDFDGNVTV